MTLNKLNKFTFAVLFSIVSVLSLSIGKNTIDTTITSPHPAYIYNAKVDRVKDGDTIEVDIDLGFEIWKHGESLRLFRVYAPETFRPLSEQEKIQGLKVKDFLIQRLTLGKNIVIQTEKDKKDKYGRYLVEIWDSEGSVNDAILKFMSDNNILSNKK